MGMNRRGFGAALAAAALARPAVVHAQAVLPIGFVTTLSGPAGYLGEEVRAGFELSIAEGGDALGGTKVRLLVEDDAARPGQGQQAAERLMGAEGARLFSGLVFSNVAGTVVPAVLDAGGIFVSANAGPAGFAGRECHPNYFVVSWLTDSMQASAGALASDLGYRRVVVLAPNFITGREAVAGFRRLFRGEVAREVFTRPDQVDFSAEMAIIRSERPDAVYQFHPGGTGIAFLRQYQGAGLLGAVPMVVSEPSMDHRIVAALGEAALGIDVSGHWNADFPNEANRRFVAAFGAKHGRVPTMYAAQGFDTANAIGAALRATGGSIADRPAFRAAMLKADFASVRGDFSFGTNQHPVQGWWGLKVAPGADGKPTLVTQRRILAPVGDAFAGLCKP